MNNLVKSVLYGVLSLLMGVSSFLFYNIFTRFTEYSFFNEFIISAIKFSVFISVIAAILIYKVLHSEGEDLKWKTLLKNILILFIIAIIIFFAFIFYVKLFYNVSGEGGLYVFYLVNIIFRYFIILSIFSTVFAWIFYASEKLAIASVVLLFLVSILVSFTIFYMNAFCFESNTRCFDQRALERNDVSLCNRGTRACYGSLAAQRNDETLCINMQTEESRTECYIGMAKTKREGTICKLVSGKGYNDVSLRLICCLDAFNIHEIPGSTSPNDLTDELALKALTMEQKSICGL